MPLNPEASSLEQTAEVTDEWVMRELRPSLSNYFILAVSNS